MSRNLFTEIRLGKCGYNMLELESLQILGTDNMTEGKTIQFQLIFNIYKLNLGIFAVLQHKDNKMKMCEHCHPDLI